MQDQPTGITMEKSAEFGTTVLDVIKQRRSRRAYSTTPVEREKIESIFEAARWAPSSVNEQPWAYLYATRDQELWQRVFGSLNEGNKVWAGNAPLLIVSLARKNFLRNDLPNHSARYDVGAANAFLSLQATALGLNVHQIGGFDRAKLTREMNIPGHFEAIAIIAIGYPGETSSLPEHLQAREMSPRVRYVRDTFVMNTAFGE